MQKITPFLWFDNQAEEAVNFYTSVFKDSKIKNVMKYSTAGPGPEGSIMSATLELNGQEFILLNAGPLYTFTPAVSFFIHCKTQEEVDYYWERLNEGGMPNRCGWLQDKFGLSWQVVPDRLGELLSDNDRQKAANVMEAMLKMNKLDINVLEEAYNKETASV